MTVVMWGVAKVVSTAFDWVDLMAADWVDSMAAKSVSFSVVNSADC